MFKLLTVVSVCTLVPLSAAPAQQLLVSSFGNNRVLEYSTTGSFGATLAQGRSSGGLDGPLGLVFGPDGNLYVTSPGSDEVLRYNGATGAFIDAFVSAGSGGLDSPTYLDFLDIEPLAVFMRGDVNADGTYDFSEAVYTLGFLFRGGLPPPCVDAADISDEGEVSITSAIYSLSFLVARGAPPLPPYSSCDADLTADPLGCESFPSCD
jgi:hypothetical protein